MDGGVGAVIGAAIASGIVEASLTRQFEARHDPVVAIVAVRAVALGS